MRYLSVLALCVFTSLSALAEAPVFTPPEVIPVVGGYALYTPSDPSVKEVEYEGLDGEGPIPLRLVGGSKTAFVFPVRGLPNNKAYRFVGVASSKDGELVKRYFKVVIGTEPTNPPPVVEPPPVTNPPTGKYFFLVVRPDGAASQDFTSVMQLEEWKTLSASGHKYKDKTKSEAKLIGVNTDSVTLPVVVVLFDDGMKSRIVTKLAMPKNGSEVTALPTLVK